MRMEDVLGNDYRRELIEASEAADGRFCAGKNGVRRFTLRRIKRWTLLCTQIMSTATSAPPSATLRCTRCGGLAAIFPPGRC